MNEINQQRERRAAEAARQSLDASADEIPDGIASKLVEARKQAIARANTIDQNPQDRTVVEISRFRRQRVVWGGAIAASIAALAITLSLQQAGENTDLLTPFASDDPLLVLADVDDTEWLLVQELEFALWLSEFGDDAATADFSG